MMKSLFIGLWACVITVAASYMATSMRTASANHAADAPAVASENRKTREINVPVIRQGVVKGYVVAELTYVVDTAIAKQLPASPDAYVSDEAFRFLYNDEAIDFTRLEKLDLGKLTQTIRDNVNARLKANVITDVGVLECNFEPNAEAKPRQ